MGLGVSRRAEHWAVRAWLRDLSRLRCARRLQHRRDRCWSDQGGAHPAGVGVAV